MKKLSITILSLLTALLPACADEGMWTLFNLPNAVFERMQTYGFQLPKESLQPKADGLSLPSAIVNFSGYCTGEVVSPMGLVMTNHHCGFEAIRSHSTVEHDYMLNGFVADSLKDELPNEGMFVAFMINQEDVTEQLTALGIDSLISGFDRNMLIDSLEEEMNKQVKELDSTCYVEIDPFYEGNAYYATTYRSYPDIRLVFALPKSMGKFGGETDNWMWPRQTCDFSVFRIYVDPETGGPAEYSERNVPMGTVATDSTCTVPYLQVSTEGYNDGDFAMILGYPGSTERYLSSYGIEEMRNCINDPIQQVRGVKQEVMKRHMAQSEAVRIKYDSKFAQSSNYWKNAIGMNKCIDSIGIVSLKREFEQRLSNWVDTVNTDTAAVEEDWENNLSMPLLASYYEQRREAMRAYTLFAETFTRRSNNELAIRATKYSDGMPVSGPEGKPRRQYVQFPDNSDSWDRDLDSEAMAVLLKNYREQAPKHFLPSIYEKIDKEYGGDCRKYVDYVWDNSILMTSKKIPMRLPKKLRNDPGIELSMSLVETMADIRMVLDSLKDSITWQERMLCMAKVRMEQDLPHYSDANFTMRLTYGQVGGYKLPDYDSGYYTTAQSMIDKINLYERDSALTNNPYEEYFAEPIFKDYLALYGADAHNERKTATPGALCFLTNNDITGGNSGSPVIDGKGRLLGLAFDGTWDSLSSDIFYDATLARTISVDIRYILFMMKHWGHADRLLKEMNVH